MEPWLAVTARRHGSRVAIETPDANALTYAELYARARSAAGGLRERGVKAGDRVALALPSAELVPLLHACTLIGAAAVPIDLRLRPEERSTRMRGAALALDAPVSGDPVGPTERDPADTATVMFTSGTTAGPKEVRLSYDNWLWNAIGSALALGLDPAERWLCPMPLAHVGGLSIQIRSAVYGTTVVLHDRFDTGPVLAALSDPAARITLVSLVPTMLARLLDAGLRHPPHLRWALLGGGPIAPALLQRARAAGVPVAYSYGMTEACSQIATNGWPLLGTEVRISDEDEVLVRGRTVAAGALAEDGWLHTGDLGGLDDAGRLVIRGRRADTIITGGENVAPDEVEAALLEHPGIRDAAVFGRPDPEWGEAVVARIVPAGEPAPTAAELREHCAARLAPFKVPKLIEPVAAVPRGPTGKLLRRELR
jgi:O-succinylbenzoic acid--CoA ligase